MNKSPKRPRDLNEWAKRMVDIATGEVDDGDQIAVPDPNKDAAAVALGQRAAGRAPNRFLQPNERK
jgi:hypothetical protein